VVSRDQAEPPSIADRLKDTLAQADPDTFTFADLLEAGGDKAFVLLLVLMNLPNVIFAPPIVAGAVAVPTTVFGAQLMLGHARPKLPAWLLRQKVAIRALQRVLDASGSWLRRLERSGRPRLTALGDLAPRLLGFFAVLGGFIILLPIPGTNVLPALGIVVLGIGALRRDGLMTLIGAGIGLLGVLATVLAAGLVVELVRWALDAL
jgi:hypothetical protein